MDCVEVLAWLEQLILLGNIENSFRMARFLPTNDITCYVTNDITNKDVASRTFCVLKVNGIEDYYLLAYGVLALLTITLPFLW